MMTTRDCKIDTKAVDLKLYCARRRRDGLSVLALPLQEYALGDGIKRCEERVRSDLKWTRACLG